MKIIIRLILNIFALYVVAYLVPGFEIEGLSAALVAAIVIGLINTLIKPILQLIALPITIITFGIFAFLINVFLLWLASVIGPGFVIDGFWTAILSSIVLSLVSWFLNKITK